MLSNNIDLKAPVRQIKGKAELYNGSAITASGATVAVSGVYPKENEIKVNTTSKNILDAKTLASYNNGTEYVADGESFTLRGNAGDVNGAASGQLMIPYGSAPNIAQNGLDVEVGATYTVSFNAQILEVGNNGNGIAVLIYSSNGSSVSVVYTAVITITENTNNRYSFNFTPKQNLKHCINFRVNNNLITISNIQIEKAADDTPFTPYLTDTSTIGVKRYGKNLFKQAVYGDYTFNDLTIEYLENEDCFLLNGSTTTTLNRDVFFTKSYFLGNVGAKYTLSHHYISGDINYPNGTSGRYSNTFLFTSNDKPINSSVSRSEFISLNRMENKSQQKTATLSQNYFNGFRFYITKDVVFTNYKFRIQLEENSSATEYESYKEPVEVINGVVPALANNTLISDNAGALITAEYSKEALVNTFNYTDALQEFTVDRVGENKFFGFGICQKANIKLRDKERVIQPTTNNCFKLYLDGINPYSNFYITETNRAENTNALSITAYDAIKLLEKHTVSELGLSSYTIKEFAEATAERIGASLEIIGVNDESFNTGYDNGANFDGAETLREALNDVAEATQTIYYMSGNKLVFKRLSVDGEPVYTITKDDYITLDSKTNRRLTAIVSATELGDNYSAKLNISGSTQYIRDNAFLELRDDVAGLVDNALAAVGNLTINQFNCSWRGNYLIELGDKIALTTKDDNTVITYLLNDSLKYNGAMSAKTQWSYNDEEETASNPTSLGDVLKQTYAKVDKANKEIEIVASATNENKTAISQLALDTNEIKASVSKVETTTAEAVSSINENITTLTEKVSAQITEKEVKLQIETELANGVDKVITATGFRFDKDGLNVSKDGAEMNTQITEDGMQVRKGTKPMLTANNKGVDAENLKATTYLIIGKNSRFESYGSNRTGCFWIGG